MTAPAAGPCPLHPGTTHRPGSRPAAACAARLTASDTTDAAQDGPTATGPVTVRADDLAGCLALLDGRLIATPTGVLPVSGYGRRPGVPMPAQVADTDAVLTLLLEAGATRRRGWRFTPAELEAGAALLTAHLAAETAAEHLLCHAA